MKRRGRPKLPQGEAGRRKVERAAHMREAQKLHWGVADPYADKTLKPCPRCGPRERKNFNRNSCSPDGLFNTCRDCTRRKYSEKPMRSLLQAVKSRAKKRGLTFNLEIEDVVVPDLCPILGIPLRRVLGHGGGYCSPSIDRIDNTRGYVSDNVCVVSKRANALKGDGTAEEHEAIAYYMRRHKAVTSSTHPDVILSWVNGDKTPE